ncbi:ATP-dependent DNA ligase [Micromonospora aurantiaca (nom. illeg.)]|uniref:ATP-dependent DNA ligase n=1 Tax=Micromonospora aurantiaca (nom. illeg.) TaxID=47850 RepID=UPI00378C9DB1
MPHILIPSLAARDAPWSTCLRRSGPRPRPWDYVQLQINGELVVWERGRTNFVLLQRRVTASRQLLREAREHPAYYIAFDLLVEAAGEPVLDAPPVERRARLLRLLAGAPPQLAVTPQSADVAEVSGWLTTWIGAGVEGVVIKRLDSRYEPGRRGWAKFRAGATTEAIIGGVTGSIRNPETLPLGRFDRRGRLR